MSEIPDSAPVPDDDVEEIQDDEQSAQEAARSLPDQGSADDPGSMINP
ncbi:hypothetical protein [Cellulomonas soli]